MATFEPMRLAIVVLVLLAFSRCAQVAPLSGGKRDTTPPRLVSVDPPDSLNFRGERIVLKFDEFVQLKDIGTQLSVNPRLRNMPEISASGKSIIIALKPHDLEPNTTYQINFGKAIADLHESNSDPSFTYVFSTGDHFDTLQLAGTVFDAANNFPVEGVRAGLYPSIGSDSLLYKEQPAYAVLSDASGHFEFHHLPARPFRLAAITDKNRNGTYDPERERVGFASKAVMPGSDSAVAVALFSEEPSRLFVKKSFVAPGGQLKIVVNARRRYEVTPLPPLMKSDVCLDTLSRSRDTLTVYQRSPRDTFNLLLSYGAWHDTVRIKSADRQRKAHISARLNTKADVLAFGVRPQMDFGAWMDTARVDSGRIHLRRKTDSVAVAPRIKWTGVSRCVVDSVLPAAEFELRIDTGAFHSATGIPADSARFVFRQQGALDLGELQLKVTVNEKQPYVMQLQNSAGSVVRDTAIAFSLSSSNAVTLVYRHLLPDNYKLRVVFDDNANGVWDTGNVIREQQPEHVFISSKELKVIADWEVEEAIEVKR